MEKYLAKRLFGFSIQQCLEFLFGVGGIYLSYTAYGYYQEKITRSPYFNPSTHESERFSGFFILVFPQFFLSFAISKLILMIQNFNNTEEIKMDFKDSLIIGLLNATTTSCSNWALQYVSYPLQTLMKSAKVLSVVFISLIVGGKRHSLSKYLSSLFIFIGIFTFQFFDGNKKQSTKQNTYAGIFLLIFSLIIDGLLSDSQEKLRQKFQKQYNRQINQWQLQVAMNFSGSIIIFVLAIISGQAVYAINFIQKYPIFILDLFQLTLCGTIGQIFIFYVISKYGAIQLSIITTTRKCLTIWLSIIIFQHQVTPIQLLGIVFVVIALIIETKESYDKQQLKNKQQISENSVRSISKNE